MMSELPRLSGETFAMERLRADPQLDYETLRRAAEEAGLTMQPIQFGRARRQLGLTGSPVVQKSEVQASEVQAPAVQAPAVQAPEVQAPESPPPATTPSLTDQQVSERSIPIPPAETAPTPTTLPSPQAKQARKSTPAFEFLVESLRSEPTISYGELKARAHEANLKVAPIMYGRAKALLGLVPVRPRGQGKNRKPTGTTTRLQALKPVDASTPDQLGAQLERVRSVDDLVKIVKQLDSERRRLRALLDSIANSIDETLGYADGD